MILFKNENYLVKIDYTLIYHLNRQAQRRNAVRSGLTFDKTLEANLNFKVSPLNWPSFL